MKRYILTATLLLLICVSFVRADDVITIRLSYKVVLNPADGTRPFRVPSLSIRVTDGDIDNAINAMNALEATYYRGYRFQRVDPVTDIGGQGDVNGPSRWYNTNFFANNGAKDDMENAAMRNPGLFAWNANAINIYITNGICGGICSFPDDNDHIVIMGGCSSNDGVTQLHEIGHYFSLFHTQGKNCGCYESGKTGECHTKPGDDENADTLPDLACWDRNDIANWTYKTKYANLNDTQKNLVDDVFLNIMSYHDSNCGQGAATTRMTELQLDKWAAFIDGVGTRRVVRDGRTWFVGTPTILRDGLGTSYDPYRYVSQAVNSANPNGGDIIMLKPGAYRGSSLANGITITKPVTLRATRAGAAVIGTTNFFLTSTPRESDEEILAKLKKETPEIFVNRADTRLGFAGSGKK